jgi:uncharacterized membrane protein
MNVNAMGAILILITAGGCFATYLVVTKVKCWIARLIPAFLCLIGAIVYYFIYKNTANHYDFVSFSYTVVFLISFSVAFLASILTICVVYLKAKWAEVFKKNK